ncbi:LANO_0G08790g1_1 [Lachancea nothofagi CBS 11611]|uniref:LANO_0G08790g1_1 n=1 Tax=Lachancea nothofagi CBS 11611 TaxID=1266666 RepID=A0A1G4KI72_9SACH|nr:LANO_0G08790g1_1 [Lachancea nothofagi CBS 11611]
MDTPSLIGSFFPATKQRELLQSLVDTEKFGELYEVLGQIDFDTSILAEIEELTTCRVLKILDKGLPIQNAELSAGIVKLLTRLDTAFAEVQRWALRKIQASELESATSLEVLETLYTLRNDQESPQELQLARLIVSLLASDNARIAKASSQIVKWQIRPITRLCKENSAFDDYVWNQVSMLLTAGSTEGKLKNGLLFVLRTLAQRNYYSSDFMSFLKTDAFWNCLQRGLAHEVHEIRKYSLSILKIILQTFPAQESFSNSFIVWSPKSRSILLATWKKFTTLYEIVALDTTLNQFEAASGDILDLLGSEFINSQWVLIIFSTGLRANMESVRRYTVKLMFQIKDKSVFQASAQELCSIILPTLMYAPYFSVVGNKCSHGEALCDFVAQLITHTHESPNYEKVTDIVSSILKCLYQQQSAFDPPKIYICFGLYKALSQSTYKLNQDQVELIAVLFNVRSEEKIFETTIQTLYLKLLMQIKVDISFFAWVNALVKHVKASSSGYGIISPLIDDFMDVALVCFDKSKVSEAWLKSSNEDAISAVLCYLIFGFKPQTITSDFLKELARSGQELSEFKDRYADYLLNLINFEAPNFEYENSSCLATLPIFDSRTWSSVKLDILYDSLGADFDAEKFKFFVRCYQLMTNYSTSLLSLKLNDLLKLYEFLKAHCEKHSGHFRYKDSIYRDYFAFLLSFLKSYALQGIHGSNEGELGKILSLMSKNVLQDNGNYEGNLAVAQLCQYILDTYLLSRLQDTEGTNDISVCDKIVQILCGIWDPMARDRLILNERELQLQFIETLFHPTILFFASGSEGLPSQLAETLYKYGGEIVAQSVSRRTFLPRLGQKINLFMETFGQSLQGRNHNYRWLMNFMFQVFVQGRSSVNSYKLKPIIARSFDEQVDTYHSASSGLYEKIYQTPEISGRIYVISALLHASDDFKQAVFVEMIENDTNLLKAKKSTDGAEESERLLKWQLLMLLLPSLDSSVLSKYSLEFILPSILIEASPLVRVYAEWIVAITLSRTCFRNTSSEIEDALFELMEDHTKPSLAVTATRTLYVSLKGTIAKEPCKRFLQKFTSKLVPNCASNKPLIRHFSNSLILSFWPSLKDFVEEETLADVLENLYVNSQKLQVHGQFRLGDAVIWDLEKDLKLTSIFGGVLMKISDHSVPYIKNSIFQKYLTCVDKLPIGRDETELWLAKRTSGSTATGIALQKDSPLQTKSGAWETVMNVDDKTPSEAVKRTPLIVVASLVDKPPNLGGICRLCDVLGAGLLTVHDIRVKNHSQFKSVAVTADRWMPMEAVPINEITNFMRIKKRDGYTLIGLEQTDRSILLDNKYQFPAKSLILLGTEAQGIPGHLLSELDLCLEIKQSGVIRSMNIQTATAVIVHSYSAQHV